MFVVISSVSLSLSSLRLHLPWRQRKSFGWFSCRLHASFPHMDSYLLSPLAQICPGILISKHGGLFLLVNLTSPSLVCAPLYGSLFSCRLIWSDFLTSLSSSCLFCHLRICLMVFLPHLLSALDSLSSSDPSACTGSIFPRATPLNVRSHRICSYFCFCSLVGLLCTLSLYYN